MLGVGIVGIGFMGMVHYLAAGRSGVVRVVALCSRDPRKLAGDWTGIRGNFGPPGAQMDLSGVAGFERFDDLLADPSVGLVDLCVPSDQHARLAIRALEAGKDVLVEKPIAIDLDDADRMLDAARSSGRRLLVAHVLPFFPEFAFARDAVSSGRHGKLLAAHFTRIISRPDWSEEVAELARSGGPAIDLHIHDTHYVGLIAGPPASVRSSGVVEAGTVLHLTTEYFHEDRHAPAITATSGALCQDGRPFAQGFELYFEGATLSLGIAQSAEVGSINPLALILPGGRVEFPTISAGDPIDAFAEEFRHAARVLDGVIEPGPLDAGLARQALATCWAEVRSVIDRREVVVPVLKDSI